MGCGPSAEFQNVVVGALCRPKTKHFKDVVEPHESPPPVALLDLPLPVLIEIFTHLSRRDAAALRCVCRALNVVIDIDDPVPIEPQATGARKPAKPKDDASDESEECRLSLIEWHKFARETNATQGTQDPRTAALFWAAEHGHAALVTRLLAGSADFTSSMVNTRLGDTTAPSPPSAKKPPAWRGGILAPVSPTHAGTAISPNTVARGAAAVRAPPHWQTFDPALLVSAMDSSPPFPQRRHARSGMLSPLDQERRPRHRHGRRVSFSGQGGLQPEGEQPMGRQRSASSLAPIAVADGRPQRRGLLARLHGAAELAEANPFGIASAAAAALAVGVHCAVNTDGRRQSGTANDGEDVDELSALLAAAEDEDSGSSDSTRDDASLNSSIVYHARTGPDAPSHGAARMPAHDEERSTEGDEQSALNTSHTMEASVIEDILEQERRAHGELSAADKRKVLDATPIYLASVGGHAAVVRALIQLGADPNLPAEHPPLHAAVEASHLEVVKALLRAGNSKDQIRLNVGAQRVGDGFTALHVAASMKDTRCLELLLTHSDADINVHSPKRGLLNGAVTPLMEAARVGSMDAVHKLLRRGAHIDAVRDDGMSAVLVAAQAGHREVVGELLRNGASMSLPTDEHSWWNKRSFPSPVPANVFPLLPAQLQAAIQAHGAAILENAGNSGAATSHLQSVATELGRFGAMYRRVATAREMSLHTATAAAAARLAAQHALEDDDEKAIAGSRSVADLKRALGNQHAEDAATLRPEGSRV